MTVDLSVFVVMALTFLAIAWRKRKSAQNVASFHIASWTAGPFALVASLVALFGAGELSTFTEYYQLLGSAILIFFFGVASGFVFVALSAEHFFSLRQLTSSPHVSQAYQINDTVFDRFGPTTGWLFTVLAGAALLALYLIQVIVGSMLISVGTGVSYEVAVVGVSLLIAAYVILSGLEGIYATDKLQFVALLVGLIAVIVYASRQTDVSLGIHYSRFFDALDLPTAAILFFTGVAPVVGTADVLQRVISAKSASDIRRVAFLSAIGWLILGMIIVAFSAGVTSYGDGTQASFVAFLAQAEGEIRVVAIVALVCALVSTADTEAHALGVLINRAVSPRTPPTVGLSRILIGVTCFIGGGLALFFQDLVTAYVFLLNIALILGPVIVAMAFKRGTRASMVISLAVSTTILAYYTFADLRCGSTHSTSIEVLILAVPTLMNLVVRTKIGVE